MFQLWAAKFVLALAFSPKYCAVTYSVTASQKETISSNLSSVLAQAE